MMAVVIAALFIVNIVFARKIAAKVRYFMWVVVMIGLLIPFRPTIGDGVIDVPNLIITPVEINEHPPSEIDSVGTIEMPVTPPVISDQSVVANEQISLQGILFIVWVSVAVGIISYHFFQYLRFQKSIKRWGTFEDDEGALTLFERVKSEMKLQNYQIQVVVCGFVSTSMLTGFFKPVILLPERNYDEAELELIFRHELIHYRRKDLWIKLLSVIALAIHWFNPFVYLMNIALQTEGEASCDQEVLEASKLKNRHFYAEVIIGMIGGKRSGTTTLATNFYGGKKGIKKRLSEVMEAATPKRTILGVVERPD
jgi:beta-lactamase regulating signal transducer with metallopeptidase domain